MGGGSANRRSAYALCIAERIGNAYFLGVIPCGNRPFAVFSVAIAPDRLIPSLESGMGAPRTSTVGFTRSVRISGCAMKVRNSLKSLRNRHRDNRLVRRKGRVYIINKTQKRFKARQG